MLMRDKIMLMIPYSRVSLSSGLRLVYIHRNACLRKSVIKSVCLVLTLYYCCKQVNSRGKECQQPGVLRCLWHWYTGAKTQVPLPKRSVRQGLSWGSTAEQHKPAMSSSIKMDNFECPSTNYKITGSFMEMWKKKLFILICVIRVKIK